MTHHSRIPLTVGVWIFVFAATAISRADVMVFNNFGAGLSYNTGAGNFVGNAFDGSGNNYGEGVEFTPYFTANLSSLDIALSCFFGCSDSFTVSLDASSSGAPGAALESFTISGASLGPLGTNNPALLLTSVLMPTLTAGTPYWVTVTSDVNDSIVWNWNSTGDTSADALSTDGGSTWFAPSGETPGAVRVGGSVPEPGAIVLLSTVVLLLAIGSRRRVGRVR
jgi:hypothetical protein